MNDSYRFFQQDPPVVVAQGQPLCYEFPVWCPLRLSFLSLYHLWQSPDCRSVSVFYSFGPSAAAFMRDNIKLATTAARDFPISQMKSIRSPLINELTAAVVLLWDKWKKSEVLSGSPHV